MYVHFKLILDVHTCILERVLESVQVTPLEEPPCEGQICIIERERLAIECFAASHVDLNHIFRSHVRVVVDQICKDGRVGVHGLDQVTIASFSLVKILFYLT